MPGFFCLLGRTPHSWFSVPLIKFVIFIFPQISVVASEYSQKCTGIFQPLGIAAGLSYKCPEITPASL